MGQGKQNQVICTFKKFTLRHKKKVSATLLAYIIVLLFRIELYNYLKKMCTFQTEIQNLKLLVLGKCNSKFL